jgi:hypothetical protein
MDFLPSVFTSDCTPENCVGQMGHDRACPTSGQRRASFLSRIRPYLVSKVDGWLISSAYLFRLLTIEFPRTENKGIA